MKNVNGAESGNQIQREIPHSKQNVNGKVINSLYILRISCGGHGNKFVIEETDPAREKIFPEPDAHTGGFKDIIVNIAVEQDEADCSIDQEQNRNSAVFGIMEISGKNIHRKSFVVVLIRLLWQ